MAIETGSVRPELRRAWTEQPGISPFSVRPKDSKESVDPARPVVARFGKLLAGLPKLFESLDTNLDAQIALYEWRKAGYAIDGFEAMDLDHDGLLTADEWFRYARERKRAAGDVPETAPSKAEKK